MSRAAMVVVLVVAGLAWPQHAGADEEAARAHFDAATARLDAGDLRGALAEYRAAYELAPRAKILLNIGAVLLELGESAEAANTFEAYLARGDLDPERAPLVRETLAELDRELARVAVDVRFRGADVELDGAAIGTSPVEVTRRLRPGEHEVALVSGGARRVYPFEVSAGGAHRVVVSEDPFTSAAADAPPRPLAARSGEPGTDDRSTSLWGKPGLWTGLATGAVLASGVVFGAQARAAVRDIGRLNRESSEHAFTEALALEDRARDRALYANIAFAVSAAGAIVTTVLVVRDRRTRDRSRVSLTPMRGGGAVTFGGRF